MNLLRILLFSLCTTQSKSKYIPLNPKSGQGCDTCLLLIFEYRNLNWLAHSKLCAWNLFPIVLNILLYLVWKIINTLLDIKIIINLSFWWNQYFTKYFFRWQLWDQKHVGLVIYRRPNLDAVHRWAFTKKYLKEVLNFMKYRRNFWQVIQDLFTCWICKGDSKHWTLMFYMGLIIKKTNSCT